MKKDMIWGFMLYLSDHMWTDETSKGGWYDYEASYNENISTDIAVWDRIIAFLGERRFNLVLVDVGDGIKFESHPEISAPNAWDKDFLKKKLDEMRAMGIEPIPKLNFSAGHDTWMKKYRRLISTPEYYRFCADVIAEVCEVFGYPRLFHLGLDEESAAMQKNYEMITVRGEDLWWHDAYFLFKECEKHGARPWVWSDYLWHNEEAFLKHMPKSVLQTNWYYQPFANWQGTIYTHRDRPIACYEILEKHGYDQLPCGSTWSCKQNLYQTMEHAKKYIADERLYGFLTAPWNSTNAEDYYTLLADASRFYYARKKAFPESLG